MKNDCFHPTKPTCCFCFGRLKDWKKIGHKTPNKNDYTKKKRREGKIIVSPDFLESNND